MATDPWYSGILPRKIVELIGVARIAACTKSKSTNFAMEPPVNLDGESMRDERVKVLKATPPLNEKNLVRGQFRDYRKEEGVAEDSKTETFAALRLDINSCCWQGTPFYVRTGKCLPVTCTEILVRLRRPPGIDSSAAVKQNHIRLRISFEVTTGIGIMVMSAGEEMIGESAAILGSRQPGADDVVAYERVLGDALARDATLFARQDYVEEVWRIVDPVLEPGTSIYEYDAGTWGPREVDQRVIPPGGWHNRDILSLKNS